MQSLSIYLTRVMIQLVPLLQPHSHLIFFVQDSNLQSTYVAFVLSSQWHSDHVHWPQWAGRLQE